MATSAQTIAALGTQWGLVTPQRITEGITHRQMAALMKEAAADAEKLIAYNVGKLGSVGAQVTAAQLRAATAGLSALSTELWVGTGQITRAGMYQAAQAAADQSLDLDLIMGMPGKGILQYAHAIHFEAAQSVESVISRRTAGFKLADRIYAHGKLTTKQVGRIVEKNLLLQRSARDIAKEVKNHFSPTVPGGTSYAAMRLGRTEINNAHHETTKRLAKKKPWVLAMKWNLSKSHPKPDPCDAYATHQEGLGVGVFADPPSKPHPQCLCWLTHVHEDEDVFMDKLAKGQYDDYLVDNGVVC
jgi:hypothetical protein